MLKKVLFSLLFIPVLYASAPGVISPAEKRSKAAMAQFEIVSNLVDQLKAVLDQYSADQISIKAAQEMVRGILAQYRQQASGPLLGVVEAINRLVGQAVHTRIPILTQAGTQLVESFKGTDPEQIQAAVEKIKTAPGQYSVKDLQYAAAVAQKQGVEQGVEEIKEALEVKKQAQQAILGQAIKQEDEQAKKWWFQRAAGRVTGAVGGVTGTIGGARERLSRYWWGEPQLNK